MRLTPPVTSVVPPKGQRNEQTMTKQSISQNPFKDQVSRRHALLMLGAGSLAVSCRTTSRSGANSTRLLAAYPFSNTELHLVFSGPINTESATTVKGYSTACDLKLLNASMQRDQTDRVVLTTEPMSGKLMIVDRVIASGVRAADGTMLRTSESAPFLQGIVEVQPIQSSSSGSTYPFETKFEGVFASASCAYPCGPPQLVENVSFTFLRQSEGGRFSGLKVETDRIPPDIERLAEELPPHLSVHVLFTGGVVHTKAGETRLMNVGYTQSSIIQPNPIPSPEPLEIRASDISNEAAPTLRAKSLQGVWVKLSNLRVVSIEPAEHGRRIRFQDESGTTLGVWAVEGVNRPLEPGQVFERLLGHVHQPKAGEYEVVVFFDKHMTPRS